MNWIEMIHTAEVSRSDARSKGHPQPPQPHRQPRYGCCLARTSVARVLSSPQLSLYFRSNTKVLSELSFHVCSEGCLIIEEHLMAIAESKIHHVSISNQSALKLPVALLFRFEVNDGASVERLTADW
jgi:hypothetical protein